MSEDGCSPLIVGLAGRLPKSDNVQEFWNNLLNKRDMIGRTRWPEGLFEMPPRAGLINNVDKFDADYFGFTESEAQSMNPLLRHMFEVCYECVVDSGLPVELLQNNTTGMYTACFLPGHDGLEVSRWANSKYCTTVDQITGHVMRYLKLSGPMATVDTACSSALSALEMAVTDLELGRCHYALVAGCNLLLNPAYIQMMMKLGMLNPTGQSNVFDANAGGYVRAEGIVAILLTRQQHLCKRIYASVVDIVTGCDGFKEEGITFPSAKSQADMIKMLYKRAGVDVNMVAYMEAHSTGTKAGDPVEVSAIAESLCKERKEPLLVGSVKANMGHSEATAALASLVKCLLVAQYGVIPPQINYNTTNPKLTAVTEGKVVIVNKPTKFPDGYIGLNSFGFGGANGHLILKPYVRSSEQKEEIYPMVVPVTARTDQELASIGGYIKQNFQNTSQLALLANSVLSNDKNRPLRGFYVTYPKRKEVSEGSLMETAVVPDIWLYLQDFVWDFISVSPGLLDNLAFNTSLESSQKILRAAGEDIYVEELIRSGSKLSPVTREGFMVALTSLIGIVDVIRTADVKISGVISNGMSELVAGYVDGCLSKEECLKLACIIGRALEGVSKTEPTYGVYKTTLKISQAHVLGPKARILSVHSEESVIVALERKHEEATRKRIRKSINADLKELPHHIPLYSDFIKGTAEALKPQIQKLLPSPKLRSPRMLSSTMDFTYGDHSSADSRFDDTYVTNLLCTSMLSTITKTLPADVLLLDIGMNAQRLTLKSSETCTSVFDPLECEPNLNSVLQTLGQIHLHGHTINTAPLYKTDFPLDVKAPSISPLVSWDHSVSYPIPEWPEYYCRVKDEAVCPYIIDSMDLEGIHTPLGCLLYHSWMAINQKHQLKSKMVSTELHKLSVNLDPSATLTSLANTVIQVQTGKQYFAAQSEGEVIMSGYYKIAPEEVNLPVIPGYDQDVNQNIYVKEDDSDIQRTEILWEDSWLDFVDTLLEFSMQWLEGPLSKVYIDPEAHMKTVTNCANLLAVAEPCTGLCKAGSVVLETVVSRSKVKDGQKSQEIGEAGQTKVSMLMAYNIEGGSNVQCKVLIYQGERITDKVQVIGIVLITEEDTVCRELPLSMGWRPDDLELLLPYILAVHLLCDVADLKQGQKLLVCPPIDTVSVYMMALANEIGGSVFTSSYDVEVRQMIDSVFPFVRVLPGEWLSQNIMTLTQGDGCDICIKFTGGGLENILGLVSVNGKIIHCATPTEKEIDLGLMRAGTTLLIPDLVLAVRKFLGKSTEDIQTMLYSIQNGSVAKLTEEGFPETKGLAYSLEERSHFLDPVSFSLVLKVIENPGVNMSMLEGMTESDILAMERIHDVVTSKPKAMSGFDILGIERIHDDITSKPKDCSLADSRLGIDSVLNDKENLYDSANVLNIGQTDFSTYHSTSSTPSGVRVLTTTLESPEGDKSASVFNNCEDEPDSGYIKKKKLKENMLPKIHVDSPSVPDIMVTSPADESSEGKVVMEIPSTSTPMMKGDVVDGNLKPPSSLMHVFKARRTSMRKSSLAHLQIPPSISNFKKGVKKLDLLFVGPPPTPITPELKKVLTPQTSKEKNIVPLNDKQHGPKLFMIHPITGKIFLLKTLGHLLDMPCFGIQRTNCTPNKSIPCVASHYKNAIEMYQPVGPYYIIGYSFGSVVALEMALQMQEHGAKRACLIMLDGGPMYFHAQFEAAMTDAPPSAAENVRKEYLEMGALVTFLQMYTPVTNRDMVLKALICLDSLEERINTVVSMTYGNVVISRNPVRTKWMAAKAKMKEVGMLTPSVTSTTDKFRFADAADELIRLKRVQAAREFVTSVHILYNYRKEGKKLEGDIYLLRIKDDLPNCEDLPVDYSLQDWCTGKVHLRFYDGTHENFLNEVSGKDVAKEITKIVSDSTV